MIEVKYTEQSSAQRQNVERWLPGLGGEGNRQLVWNGYSLDLQDKSSSGDGWWLGPSPGSLLLCDRGK